MFRALSASCCKGRFRATVALSLLGSLGAAQETEFSSRDLYLEVFINGQPTDLITRFTDLGNGAVRADAQELRNTGIDPDPVATSGEVRIDRLPGISFQIDEASQTIIFTARDDARAPIIINAVTGRDIPRQAVIEEGDDTPVSTGFGLVLNYGISLETGGEESFRSGEFDARAFTPIGTLSHGFLLAEDVAGSLGYQRLETYWRTAFPGRAAQVQAGDITTRGPNWSRSVRLGGVMIERNFDLRPDLVTIPLPSYQGSAAVPSTVEVFADSIRRYATEVPEGPFALTDLPIGTGSGLAEVVLTDVAGRERRLDLPFLVSDDLLRRGIADYAIAIGRPRLGIGTSTDRYSDDIYGTATLRYGLTDSITLMAHGEAGHDLRLAGLGATFRIGTLGTSTISFAQSQSGDDEGQLIEVSARMAFGRLQASARSLRTWQEFTDIAQITADPAVGLVSARLANLDQLSLTLPFEGGGSSANLFLAQSEMSDGRRERSLGIGYAQTVLTDATLSLSALAVRGDTSDSIFGVSLHVPLGKRRHVSGAYDTRRDGQRFSVRASGRSEGNGWDWRAQAASDDAGVQGSATREIRFGRIDLAARVSDRAQSFGLRLDGAVVAAGGGVFLAPRIRDAFAVVDAGARGVAVRAENRLVGVTGRSGKILVPDLRSYDTNSLSIDPTDLPIDASVLSTRQTIRPAHRSGVTVDFGVDPNPASAVIGLVGADGAPLPVGLAATLNGGEQEFLVGYDGLVFATGLDSGNALTVQWPDGATCRAEFAYRDEPGRVTQIEGVLCQ